MGACREMRLPRSESESQSMSPFSGALDSLAAAAAPKNPFKSFWLILPSPALHAVASGVASIAFSIRFSRESRRVNR